MSRPTPAAAPLASPFEQPLRFAIALGLFVVLLLPAGRGYSQALGWLPLWLVGMPCLAWWSLYRFQLPLGLLRRQTQRRRGPQAKRRTRLQPRRTARPDLRQGGAGQAV